MKLDLDALFHNQLFFWIIGGLVLLSLPEGYTHYKRQKRLDRYFAQKRAQKKNIWKKTKTRSR